MSDPSSSTPESNAAVRQRLEELAGLVRSAGHLGPRVKEELADLLHELAAELQNTPRSAQTDHLLESAAHLARGIHEKRDQGLLAAAKERLASAAALAEAKAPVATGVARQFINILADVGI
jgi:hypothetical protein